MKDNRNPEEELEKLQLQLQACQISRDTQERNDRKESVSVEAACMSGLDDLSVNS